MTTVPDSAIPLPCPFCGSEAFESAGELIHVRCLKCQARSGTYVRAEDAVAAWNRRVAPGTSAPASAVKSSDTHIRNLAQRLIETGYELTNGDYLNTMEQLVLFLTRRVLGDQ